jgi:hypothetical protein
MQEHLLGEMRYEYGEGRLVPFLGSGMSRPVCRGWADMITQLELTGGLRSVPQAKKNSEGDDFELTRRAAFVLEQLRLEGGFDNVVSAVRDALLESGPAPPPTSTATMARLHWPLVLTTNYDDLYVAAVHEAFLGTRIGTRLPTSEVERRTPPVEIAGRSQSDCHRVLSALRRPARPLVWTLQGFLPGQARIVTRPGGGHDTERWLDFISVQDRNLGFSSQKLEELQRQLVVGHAEYRAVAMRSETFRRAFAEVYRSRSLLFLGSGLRDRYLLDLFSQIAELYGPSSQQHYAVVRRGELDAEFLQRYFGIWVVQVEDHEEIPALLESLGSPRGIAVGAIRWSYIKQSSRGKPPPSLSIVSSALTADSRVTGCVVVSGGGSLDWPRLSRGIRKFLFGSGLLPERARSDGVEDVGRLFCRLQGREFIWVLKDAGVLPVHDDRPTLLVARARANPASPLGRRLRPLAPAANQAVTGDKAGRLWRDLRLVKPVMREILDVATAADHDMIISNLLASGSLRAFPPSFALQEMVRAWACDIQSTASLEIHITEETVLTDMRSGRLDLAYPMSRSSSAPDDASSMRFWLEIAESDGRTQRLLELRDPTYPIRRLLLDRWLSGRRWQADVWPAPCLGWAPWKFEDFEAWENESGEEMSLERLGVCHGSTLRISEMQAGIE